MYVCMYVCMYISGPFIHLGKGIGDSKPNTGSGSLLLTYFAKAPPAGYE